MLGGKVKGPKYQVNAGTFRCAAPRNQGRDRADLVIDNRSPLPRKARLNSYGEVVSNEFTMRFFSIALLSLALPLSLRAAEPEVRPTPTIVPEAAEAGKDVVHQLNNAFAEVFEIVAPSVVIIETTKKNDVSDNPALDDLFFNQQQP